MGSGGVASTVVVLQDELEKGYQGEHDFADGDDEDEDTDHIDHTKLPKDVVFPHTPTKRSHTAPVWQHLQRIAKHNSPGWVMNDKRTHMCVYKLSDDEDGVAQFCNTLLTLFRNGNL